MIYLANKNLRNIALGATGIALAAAAAAAAGAVLSNKELRNKLGKRANEALKVVSKIALELEKGAESGLKTLEEKTRKLSEAGETKKLPKPRSKK